MKKYLAMSLAVIGLGFVGVATADTYANVYTCTLNDDVEMEDLFEDTNECSKNRLWKIEQTK